MRFVAVLPCTSISVVYAPAEDSTWLFVGTVRGSVCFVKASDFTQSAYQIAWNHMTTGCVCE